MTAMRYPVIFAEVRTRKKKVRTMPVMHTCTILHPFIMRDIRQIQPSFIVISSLYILYNIIIIRFYTLRIRFSNLFESSNCHVTVVLGGQRHAQSSHHHGPGPNWHVPPSVARGPPSLGKKKGVHAVICIADLCSINVLVYVYIYIYVHLCVRVST